MHTRQYPALGGGLVLVVFIRETRRLLALLIREVSNHLQDLRWLEATVQSLRGLPPGSEAELECGSRRMRIEVPGQVPARGRDAEVVPLDRPGQASGEDPEDGRPWGGAFDQSD